MATPEGELSEAEKKTIEFGLVRLCHRVAVHLELSFKFGGGVRYRL